MSTYYSGTKKLEIMPETTKNCIAFFKYTRGISKMSFAVFLEYDLSTSRIYLKYSMYKLLRERIINHLSDELRLLKNMGLNKEFLIGIDIYNQYCEFKLKSYKVKNGKFVKEYVGGKCGCKI